MFVENVIVQNSFTNLMRDEGYYGKGFYDSYGPINNSIVRTYDRVIDRFYDDRHLGFQPRGYTGRTDPYLERYDDRDNRYDHRDSRGFREPRDSYRGRFRGGYHNDYGGRFRGEGSDIRYRSYESGSPEHVGGGGRYSTRGLRSIERRQGDWDCPQCNELNFAARNVCRKCNAPRPEHLGVGGRPGDWVCFKCGDLNFASRTICRKCGRPNSPPREHSQSPKLTEKPETDNSSTTEVTTATTTADPVVEQPVK